MIILKEATKPQIQPVIPDDVEMQEQSERQHMVSPAAIKVLERQQYRMVGHHSAVKVCGWTKNMLKKKGGCYKYVFYGIRSHQCMQMTTSMFCANRCTFCWRGAKAPVSKTWYGPIDEPKKIIEESLSAHHGLLIGFKGNEKASQKLYDQSEAPRHVALSLTGEPISYPLINEICAEFHRQRISTFIVTNAQYPDQIEKVQYVTQLYISLDAPTKELLKQIDRPLFDDYYERLLQSLDIMAKKPYRTCIRLTLIKGINDTLVEQYAELIQRAKPSFIEVKSYMHVGASRNFLKHENMPSMDDVREFTQRLISALGNYVEVNEHAPSRVVCLMRDSMEGKNYIDFPKFFAMTDAQETPLAKDYSAQKMQPNI